MALGDIITYETGVGASGSVSYQPATGVAILVTSVVGSNVDIYLYNGANHAYHGPSANAKTFITDSVYIRAINATSSAGALALTGIQVRGSTVKIGDKILTGKALEQYRESELEKLKSMVGKATVTEIIGGKQVTLVLKKVEDYRGPLGDLIAYVLFWEP